MSLWIQLRVIKKIIQYCSHIEYLKKMFSEDLRDPLKILNQSHLVATKHMKKKSAAIWLKFGMVGGIVS